MFLERLNDRVHKSSETVVIVSPSKSHAALIHTASMDGALLSASQLSVVSKSLTMPHARVVDGGG